MCHVCYIFSLFCLYIYLSDILLGLHNVTTSIIEITFFLLSEYLFRPTVIDCWPRVAFLTDGPRT